jgi:hypothetical protein
MLVRVGDVQEAAEGQMRVFDVGGTRVNVAHAAGQVQVDGDELLAEA